MSAKSAEARRALKLTRLALEAPPEELFEPTPDFKAVKTDVLPQSQPTPREPPPDQGSPASLVEETVASRKGPRPAAEYVKLGLRVTQGLLYDFRMLADAAGIRIADAIRRYLVRCLQAQRIIVYEVEAPEDDPGRLIPTDVEYVPASAPAWLTTLACTRHERQVLRVMSRTSGVPITDGVESFLRASVAAGRLINGDEP